MDSNTEQLIRKLADKFGTTTEHLWEVLVTQASISATTRIIVFSIFMAIGIIVIIMGLLSRHTILKSKSITAREKKDLLEADPFIWISLVVGILIIAIVSVCAVVNIDYIVSGFKNPEYWALQHILSLIHGTN